MKSPISRVSGAQMSVDVAYDSASRVHNKLTADVRSEDDLDWAYAKFESQYGVGRWTIEHLRKKRAKSCDVGVFAKIKSAYLDLCEAQLRKLEHEIAIEKATDDADDLRDLEAEAAALAEKIAQRKARLK